jgi:hypothetical protein
MKKLFVILSVAVPVLVLSQVASEAQPLVPVLPPEPVGKSFIIEIAQRSPFLSSIIFFMGSLRMVMKPLFTFLRALVNATKTTKDNELLDKAERSKFYKVLRFVLDYVASVKLKK